MAVDYVRFANVHRRLVATASELGGHVGSIGGWPFGQEFRVRFDHPVTDDALRRLVDAVPKSPRFALMVGFTCEIPEPRLAAMRKLVARYPQIMIVTAASQ